MLEMLGTENRVLLKTNDIGGRGSGTTADTVEKLSMASA